jgi:hypothetical protein
MRFHVSVPPSTSHDDDVLYKIEIKSDI